MIVKKKKLLIVGALGALAALVPFAEKDGWHVMVVPDWTRAARKLATVKVAACVSGFPNKEEPESLRSLLGEAKWVILDVLSSRDHVAAARSMGAQAIFFVGHVTPGALLKSLV
ncbi:MAG: hypothetical protein Q7S89_03195 [bacterium]|nr:hypothetical protein [bacterium]